MWTGSRSRAAWRLLIWRLVTALFTTDRNIKNDGGGWGRFECSGDTLPGGYKAACGYYYDYDFDIPDDDGSIFHNGGHMTYLHPEDAYRGPFYFDLDQIHSANLEPPIDEKGITPQTDPCAGRKGKIDPNDSAYPREGLQHVSDRHIDPQTSDWTGKKSYFTFGWVFTKGRISITKEHKKAIVMDILQEAFEKGYANRLSGGDYAYSYAPPIIGNDWVSGVDFVGIDKEHSWEATNVRTVILDVDDCGHPKLSTGYPGLARPNDGVIGIPVWKPVTTIWR